MRIALFVLCLVCNVYVTSVTAQTKDYFQVALKDAIYKEPISFATVRIKDSRQGLIADANGEFRIPITFQTTEKVLIITSIGYESIEIEVSKLALHDINIFYLKPYIDSLNEIIIVQDESKRRRIEQANTLVKAARAKTADELIYLAIQNIPVNLNSNPSSVIGYYRDYQIVDNQYLNLNEGIVEMFDYGIRNIAPAYDSFRAAVSLYAPNHNFQRDPNLLVPYEKGNKFVQNARLQANGGNELTILNVHNPIRNYKVNTFSFVYNFSTDFINFHKTSRRDVVYLDDEPLAVINFTASPRVTGLDHKGKGTILISLRDYSIHRFNYEVYDTDRFNALFNLNIEYRRQDNHMFLNYISFNNRFVMADKDILKEERIDFTPETFKFKITFNKDIDFESVKNSSINIKYGKTKLLVNDISKRANNIIVVSVQPFLSGSNAMRELKQGDIEIALKRIKDTEGKTIYKGDLFTAYQFRELFVQEVFSQKELQEEVKLMNNQMPMTFSTPENNEIIDRYWLNSPLRGTVKVREEEE